jgi:predicted RNA-binding Zn-ribbon protein involved in translation (DUF1610 family)
MTYARLHCPNCHDDVVLPASDLMLRIGPEHSAGIRFVCPQCDARLDVPAHPRALDALTSAGVSILYVDDLGEEAPSELEEPINSRDVFDFIYALAITDTPQAELIR